MQEDIFVVLQIPDKEWFVEYTSIKRKVYLNLNRKVYLKETVDILF